MCSSDLLQSIPENGAELKPVRDSKGGSFFPHLLPGSKAILFSPTPAQGNIANAGIHAYLRESGSSKLVLGGGYAPTYVPGTANLGHLLFVRGTALYGVVFDPVALEVRGSPVPMVDDLAESATPSEAGGQYSKIGRAHV